jgi:propionyl-CoA synthetase
MPIKPGSPTVAVPGYDIRILDDEGKELGAHDEGNVVVKLPLPPGTLPTLYKDDEKFLLYEQVPRLLRNQ